ncbi:carboxypeptidase-like regulatory domain-containing protein, partial [Salmonella enterica subsp. enterica serovar Enteritidis]|uniref:carboxypeptidase-like regulatory domain-containing protein n=1 Tax=Salmonella enterica TaxID=28901 RepID=UPI0039EA94D6
SLLLFWHFQLIGQTLSGKVLDARTQQPIAFANVVYSSHKGVTSYIDVRFAIETQTPPDSIKVSYVGYKTKTVKPQKTENLHIYLQ